MDWLKGMNDVLKFIEDNLSQPIQYEPLSKIAGCSVYEFSRIFSFMAGIPVSEYIRRRRLSQAVFDIQSGNEKMIDIAIKYGYESPTAFTRAFKEPHGTTPMSARRLGVVLKTYPPISFVLTIKGVEQMKFRIEKKKAFRLWDYPVTKAASVSLTTDCLLYGINLWMNTIKNCGTMETVFILIHSGKQQLTSLSPKMG